MAPTASADARVLLEVARASIEHGVRCGRPLAVDPLAHAPTLRPLRAVFVTLRLHGELRGCTGNLAPSHPLVRAVAESAFRSAFHDPRFQPVQEHELAALLLHVSILSPLESFPVTSEAELLEKLRPGVDGLVLRDGPASATFLPSVWKSLPSPQHFVAELKRKARLAPDHWSPTLVLERYTVEEIP